MGSEHSLSGNISPVNGSSLVGIELTPKTQRHACSKGFSCRQNSNQAFKSLTNSSKHLFAACLPSHQFIFIIPATVEYGAK